jgi:outer membrane immunogenic protein
MEIRNMNFKKSLLNVAVLTALSTVSFSAISDNTDKTYAGFQYAIGTYNEDGFEEVNPTALIGRFGKYLNNSFALEGRFGIGLQDDSVSIFGTDVSLDIDTLFGIYGVGHVNINDTSSVYGLIGFTQAEATVSAPGFISESGDESGVSFGVGADIGLGSNIALNVEYTQYLNKSDFDLSAIGLGIIFSF